MQKLVKFGSSKGNSTINESSSEWSESEYDDSEESESESEYDSKIIKTVVQAP